MTLSRLWAGLALTVLPAALLGCVSLKRTPEARFFVLRSLVERPEPAAGELPGELVGVLPVVLPGYLDRPQVVTWSAPDELRIDEFLRWAEPLDLGITRTVAENLDLLLTPYRVIRSPWPSSAKVRFRVRVHLRLFGPQRSGEVRLEGRYAILSDTAERPLLVRSLSLGRGPFPGKPETLDPGAGVEAMSQLLSDMSREIAEGIRTLEP
jgi:uncharacterized lipoprotein YmbA